MAEFWVVVADESSARLFETNKIRAELNEFETLTNPEARLHEAELVATKRGRAFGSPGGGNRHTVEPPTSEREQAAIRFCKHIAERLEQGADSRAYNRLILLAPPDLLGRLRRELGQNAQARLDRSIGKDVVRAKPDEILKHLVV